MIWPWWVQAIAAGVGLALIVGPWWKYSNRRALWTVVGFVLLHFVLLLYAPGVQAVWIGALLVALVLLLVLWVARRRK